MSTATRSRAIVAEKTYSCSDGVKLAARYWSNFEGPTPQHTRKILCLHGWLDNAASFDRLAPLIIDSTSPSDTATTTTIADIPTEIVALDFPGHGLSGHKSVDGPPQLLAEYAYYVAELVEALHWGDGNASNGIPVSRTVVANINNNSGTGSGSNKEGSEEQTTSNNNIDNDNDNNGTGGDYDYSKILLIGHSMGSGVSTVLCAAFPEWFSALILLEGGLVARNARDVSRHVRAACQRRLKSNRTLFPDGSNNNGSGSDGEAILPRAKVYSSLDAAIEARLSTTRRMPGDQFLSYEAARDMVMRATVPAHVASSSTASADSESVVFRHDPRLQWPSLIYYTREQVETFFRDVHTSNIPVCFLWAADGWPVDSWAESMITDVLKPVHKKRLSGSHHFHADPDTVAGVAMEIIAFMEERKL